MQDNEKLELLLERFYNRYNKYNTKVLEKMGETISKFDGVTPTVAHQIAQELRNGYDLDELANEIAKINDISVKDVYETLDKAAKENVEFSEIYYKAKNKEFINYEDNDKLKRYVKSIADQTSKLFTNLSQTSQIGFSIINEITGKKEFKPISKIYDELIDEAVYNATSGVEDYQSAMRNTIRQLANSGVKVNEYKVEYESGYARRIDSSVRQNVLDGIRAINIGIQEQVGKEFGADGVEISVHSPCAEDHQDIQGKQYSKKSFNKLNNSLDRPIGTLNCRHFIFSIVMGVNLPNYSKKQLQEIKRESNSIVEYDGKKYTLYEATQVQRKLETQIRKQKDFQIIAKASGDKDGILQAQTKITQLTSKYKNFSNSVGLDVYKDRLTVSGYKRVAIKK